MKNGKKSPEKTIYVLLFKYGRGKDYMSFINVGLFDIQSRQLIKPEINLYSSSFKDDFNGGMKRLDEKIVKIKEYIGETTEFREISKSKSSFFSKNKAFEMKKRGFKYIRRLKKYLEENTPNKNG